MASNREAIQNTLVEWLSERNFTAPYGIIKGSHGQYRNITFGIARWLDAEIRIYSPTWLLYRDSDNMQQKFGCVNDLLGFLGDKFDG